MKRFMKFTQLLFSCSGTVVRINRDPVTFQYDAKQLDSLPGFLEKVKSIQVIPLESIPAAILSGNYGSDPVMTGDEFFIYEGWEHSEICRFSREGRFLNQIGQRRRGPEECINLRGVQLLGDKVLAYSATGEPPLLYYKKEGAKAGRGEWFVLAAGEKKLSECIKQIYDGKIYCLISPSRLSALQDLLKSKISNYQVFGDLKEDSNCLGLVLEMA